MSYPKALQIGLILSAAMFAAACATTRISPPGPAVQALLLIPVELDVKVISARYGFYYVYEITRLGEEDFSHDVAIKFPLPNDILIVDALPPGDYRVRKLTIVPAGTGDKKLSKNTASLDLPFHLETGKITFFSHVLKLTMRNQDPGRVGTVTTRIDLIPLAAYHEEEIVATLRGLENFQAWEIADP